MHRLLLLLTCVLAACSAATPASSAEGLGVQRLRCEYLRDPLGIDETRPRLSWIVTSDKRNQRQTAYQIQVASGIEALADGRPDRWDSGRIESDRTTFVEYAGKPLASRDRCYWRVRCWDAQGVPSDWSEIALWTMGLLEGSDWSAEYVSFADDSPVHKDSESLYLPAARQYRKDFEAAKKVRRATVYATALGVYELHLNGQRIGDRYFAPGWTDYDRRAYYQTYDVTGLVQQGDNALGAWVADGWYSGYVGFGLLVGIGTESIGRYTYGKTPAVLAQLEIEYDDGSRDTISTDASWKVTGEGPIREADLLMGEAYDARRELDGWASPGYDDSRWDPAVLAKDQPRVTAQFVEYRDPEQPGQAPQKHSRPIDLGFQRPRLEAFPGEKVVVTQELPTQSVTRQGEGTYLFDLGQNFAGVIRLKVKGPVGQRVKIRYGEMLHPDGRLMTENLRTARATDFYTLRGDPDGETYQPRFTFHGFQYVELSNFPGEPTKETVTGLALHSDTPLVSELECSDPMVNRLIENIRWTQRANFLDLPTDCPQRDERLGWTGDAQAYVAAAAYNADIGAFYTKWLRELMESQRPGGQFPGYAPYPFQHEWSFGTAWADAGVICPWTIWQAYGDTRVIDHCWPGMVRFMEFHQRTTKDGLGIAHGNSWGDWLAQEDQPPLEYIDTVYKAISAQKMIEMAEATGRDAAADRYRAYLDRLKRAFADKYFDDDGALKLTMQTAYALALQADLVPDELRERAGADLAARIKANGARMATGFLGTRPLLPTLTATGQNDLAVFLLQSHEFPSWGYEIDQGATTIWERWDSYTRDDGFGRHNAAMNSFAHYAFGAVAEWVFADLAGIRADGVGYGRVTIRPMPPTPGSNGDHEPIDWVRARYESIRGPIRSEWRVDGDRFELTAEVPANTTATVHVPADSAESVTLDGAPLGETPGAELTGYEAGRAVVRVGSGVWSFASRHGMGTAEEAITATAEGGE
ncbi:glycoside hydrolase family 78 protein [Botrimarina sp.]|uniref:glycoside hydrolase family 78 protein n=1 Tax=Botrimarina sp. TaxID=2795802 RepID=UPI0032ED3EB5